MFEQIIKINEAYQELQFASKNISKIIKSSSDYAERISRKNDCEGRLNDALTEFLTNYPDYNSCYMYIARARDNHLEHGRNSKANELFLVEKLLFSGVITKYGEFVACGKHQHIPTAVRHSTSDSFILWQSHQFGDGITAELVGGMNRHMSYKLIFLCTRYGFAVEDIAGSELRSVLELNYRF